MATKIYYATDHFGPRAPKGLFWGGVWAKLNIAQEADVIEQTGQTVKVFLALQSKVQLRRNPIEAPWTHQGLVRDSEHIAHEDTCPSCKRFCRSLSTENLCTSWLAGVSSWLAGVSSWLAGVPFWLAGVSFWLAGVSSGWLESLPGWLESLSGWLEFLPGWLELAG